MKAQQKIDEFIFILLAGVILIIILLILWAGPSEQLPSVEPTSLSITTVPNSQRQLMLKIVGNVTNVSLEVMGEVANWVTLSNTHFDSIQGESIVTIYVSIPPTTSFKTYKGNIKLTSTAGSLNIPISVNVQNISSIQLQERSIPVGDFSIRQTGGQEVLDSVKNIEISKGTFSENYRNLVGSLSSVGDVLNAYVKLVIIDSNYRGNLIITFNEEEVYNGKPALGELTIPLDVTKLRTSNVIKIRTTGPGWMFWSKSFYKLREASFIVEFKGEESKEISINLSAADVANFDHMTINAVIGQTGNPMLRIKVNEQTVYTGTPPSILNLWVDRDILGKKLVLNAGENKIVLKLESQGTMSFTNTMIGLYYY